MTAVTRSSACTVPPARLGLLLSQRRLELGLSVEELAASSGGSLSAEDLRLAEQGNRWLDDALIEEITAVYECSSGPIVPVRCRLIIDVDRGQIISGGASTSLPRTEPAEILERYLAFVYLMRSQKPGTRLNLRSDDVAVLARALNATPEQIDRRLIVMMGTKQVKQQTYSLRKKVAVSAAGLLVGFTSIGALILAPEVSSAATESSETDASVSTSDSELSSTTGGGPELTMPTTLDQADQDSVSTLNNPADDAPPEPGGGAKGSEEIAPAGPQVEVVPPPETPTTVNEPSITEKAEALISYDWKTHLPGWTLEYEASRPGYRGITNRPAKTITIFLRAEDTSASIADVLAHELGHALDLEHLSDDERLQWLASRGLPQVWWVGDGQNDFSVGQGDFAEAVAAVLVGSPSNSAHGEFTDAQLALAASLLPG